MLDCLMSLGHALLISWRSLSVISVFLGFSSWPITDITSCPPCANANAYLSTVLSDYKILVHGYAHAPAV